MRDNATELREPSAGRLILAFVKLSAWWTQHQPLTAAGAGRSQSINVQSGRAFKRKNVQLLVFVMLLASAMVLALFELEGRVGFSLWDEGFLWYGVQRVMAGEVPIRDFMAYDPGRYYWSAALMNLWGDNGIMSLRSAVAIFQATGLVVGLLLIARTLRDLSKSNILYLFLSSITLVLWMFPRHKLFDISLSIFLVGILTFLIENPTAWRYFVTGSCIGIVAVFGRNHGMYGVAGSLGVMVWLRIKPASGPGLIKGFALWAAGITVGYAPIILMTLLVSGFANAFLESVRFLFEVQATNLPLPIPWPWRVAFTSLSFVDAIRGLLIGVFFVGLVVLGGLSVLWSIQQKRQKKQVSPALVAASFLALPYAHFSYSRADVGHLAQGIFPLLIGCLVFLATTSPKFKWPLALSLCAMSLWVMQVVHPWWQCQAGKQCVDIEVSGSRLLVDPATAGDVKLLRDLSGKYAANGQSFIAAPLWPGAYALLEAKSPMWEIYALFPRSPTFESAEIGRIKIAKPTFAFIYDLPLDGWDKLRFRNTHPLIHQYILDNFELLPNSPNAAYQIYKTKGLGQ